MFIFRGKSATRIKILWWDSQGFCLFYKCLDSGKFPWLNPEDKGSVSITRAQLSMLIEGTTGEILSGLNLLKHARLESIYHNEQKNSQYTT